MGLLTFLKEVFQDHDGSFSSKRTVTLGAFILLCLAFLCNLFGGFTVAEFMFEQFTYIVLGGLGMATAEPLALSFRGRAQGSADAPDPT